MRVLKGLAVLGMAIALSFMHCSAQSVKYDDQRIVKKSLAVGKVKPSAADSSAWIEIGDTATTRGIILPRAKDTGTILKKKPGLLFYNMKDSSLYIKCGTVLKKITAT